MRLPFLLQVVSGGSSSAGSLCYWYCHCCYRCCRDVRQYGQDMLFWSHSAKQCSWKVCPHCRVSTSILSSAEKSCRQMAQHGEESVVTTKPLSWMPSSEGPFMGEIYFKVFILLIIVWGSQRNLLLLPLVIVEPSLLLLLVRKLWLLDCVGLAFRLPRRRRYRNIDNGDKRLSPL